MYIGDVNADDEEAETIKTNDIKVAGVNKDEYGGKDLELGSQGKIKGKYNLCK